VSPVSGELVWEFKMPARTGHGRIGGLLSTAGGLLFVGDHETFYALDAHNGQKLWSVNLGGRINAAPITFKADGHQMIAIAAGASMFAFELREPSETEKEQRAPNNTE